MSVGLISGTLAGLLLFLLQHFTISPLIEKAEFYEAAAEQRKPGMHHEDEGWQPANGAERITLTVVATVRKLHVDMFATALADSRFAAAAFDCGGPTRARMRMVWRQLQLGGDSRALRVPAGFVMVTGTELTNAFSVPILSSQRR
jgi:hypothetical protein